jgi:hypothetical protein
MKVGFFPDPYPDELLYSACARFAQRMRYELKTTTAKELFGSRTAYAIVDFPIRIDHLVNKLPPGHRYTAGSLIDNHTLLPLYAPFMSRKRLIDCKRDMRGSKNHVQSRLGCTTNGMWSPNWLRFCPNCVVEDRETIGETYWHRLHQINGVEVCPKHLVFLENSGIQWRNPDSLSVFFAADVSLSSVLPRPINTSHDRDAILLKIARDVSWLMNQCRISSNFEALRDLYFDLLLRNGYAYYNGRVRTTKLLRDFVNFYTPSLLNKLQCSINGSTYNWVLTLLMKSKKPVVKHPLRHLLLISFLGCTVEQFFTLKDDFMPFGPGPWPCLNKASTHYKEQIVKRCSVTASNLKGKRGRPTGTFSCRCGFAYKRCGPDLFIDDRYSFDCVQSYGPTWESLLRKLWTDNLLPLYIMESKLGVSSLTIVRHAIRLQLPMNISGTRQISEKTIVRHQRHRKTRNEILSDYRLRWLLLINNHPNAGRKDLIRAENSLYLWLRKNDGEWLDSHLPPPRKSNPPHRNKSIDWDRIDTTLAWAVMEIVKKIKGVPGPPIRASLAAIKKETGYKLLFENHLRKLPLTTKAVAKHIETFEAYLIRKVKWIEDLCIQQGEPPTKYSFMRQLSNGKTINTPAVQKAIDGAISRLTKILQ